MKKYLTLVVIALMAASIVSTAGVVSAAKGRATTRTLDTPQLLTPTDGVQLHIGDSLTYSWTAVNHATTYTILIQGHTQTSPDWVSMPSQTVTPANTKDKTVSWKVDGTYQGGQSSITLRWQVVASNTDTAGSWARAASAPSDVWRTISFAE